MSCTEEPAFESKRPGSGVHGPTAMAPPDLDLGAPQEGGGVQLWLLGEVCKPTPAPPAWFFNTEPGSWHTVGI